MAEPTVETDRLLLRRWDVEDYAPFAEICADPEVMRYIGDGAPQSAAQAAQAIDAFEASWRAHGYGQFAVEHRETGALIGFTGFALPNFLPEILPSVEIGWRLARRCWGRGYASEAARAALSFGVNDLGLRDIVSICQLENIASERVMQKIGLVFDRRTIVPDYMIDVAVYRLPLGQVRHLTE